MLSMYTILLWNYTHFYINIIFQMPAYYWGMATYYSVRVVPDQKIWEFKFSFKSRGKVREFCRPYYLKSQGKIKENWKSSSILFFFIEFEFLSILREFYSGQGKFKEFHTHEKVATPQFIMVIEHVQWQEPFYKSKYAAFTRWHK